MASSTLLHSLLHIPPRPSKCTTAQLLPSKLPTSRPINRATFPCTGPHGPTRRLGGRCSSPVVAFQSNFLKGQAHFTVGTSGQSQFTGVCEVL
ncbi:hypothetical protein NL676_034500 [Syzygium grande]|nr:hypothetical protein NL676_034500 [Syzygium grande]